MNSKATGSECAALICFHRYRLTAAALLSLAIFLLDTFTNLDGAVAVLYVVVIVICVDAGRPILLSASGIGAALTVVSFIYTHHSSMDSSSEMRFAFCIAANAVTTLLGIRQIDYRRKLEAQARLLEMTNDAILLRDAAGRFIFWNHGAEKLFGFSAKEALGKTLNEITTADFLTTSRPEAEALLHKNGTWQGDMRVKTASGRIVDVTTRWSLERSITGEPLRIAVTAIDVTEMRESERRYEINFETMAVAIWEHDLTAVKAEIDRLIQSDVKDIRRYLVDHPEFLKTTSDLVQISDMNQTAMKLMNIQSKNELPIRLGDILLCNDVSFSQLLLALSDGQRVFRSETAVKTPDGRTVPVMIVMNLPGHGQRLDRIQASIIDLSERVAFQEQIEASRQELEQVSRSAVIGEICASIAHEVNQPLAAATTFINAACRWLAKDPPNVFEVEAALADALKSTEHAAAVVNRVRMLLGKAKSHGALMNIHDSIKDAIQIKSKELAAASVSIRQDYQAKSPIIHGDRILLQQAFMNIVGNAVHAMETTAASSREIVIITQDCGDEILISITDSGIGLQLEPSSLFKAFSTTKKEGMGLGLAVCKTVLSAHNGTISLRDRIGDRGAVVEMRIPRYQRANASERGQSRGSSGSTDIRHDENANFLTSRSAPGERF